ncbi:hypothetical protein [Acinetobacter higginsii]|uniref:hypothetical protein n=1 Tax=Acinetobacter higginsii TaxID=70347 RepID=UPI001F4A6D95|nr:hypothetical protein [Acinetobacter higginsii]MCH7294105.1 hypothetical protein [Acinetobacter higginsii]
MPQYLRIADNIYKRFEGDNKFSAPLQDCLNQVINQLREELKDTDLKLMYTHINFVKGFQKEPPNGHLNVFMSLVPNPENKDQFVLWLSNLIEKITEGGVKKLPPKIVNIPPDVNFDSDILKILSNTSKAKKSTEKIKAYFNSQEYKRLNFN